jgi:type III restriction enzyme
MAKTIDRLIINSPYEEPEEHWSCNPGTRAFDRIPGRRPAGYFVAGQGGSQYNNLGEFRPIPLVADAEGIIMKHTEE